jgi:hypothetical protein
VYGGDRSPWVNAVLLALQGRGVEHIEFRYQIERMRTEVFSVNVIDVSGHRFEEIY